MKLGILSFLLLVLAAFSPAQSGTTLLVKTDTNCNWKLDGKAMGRITLDSPQIVLVSPGKHQIEGYVADPNTIVRTEVQVAQVEKQVDIQLKAQMDAQRQDSGHSAQKATWTDLASGLTWAVKDNGSDVDWYAATAYCRKSELAGYSDWRLPTINELQAIYDPSNSAREAFEMGLSPDVHIQGDRMITGSEWSSTLDNISGKPPLGAWFFNYGDPLRTRANTGKPGPTFLHFTYSMRALCVRRS